MYKINHTENLHNVERIMKILYNKLRWLILTAIITRKGKKSYG